MTVVYMNEEQLRAEALRIAIGSANSTDTTDDIVTRAKIFFEFIVNGGTTQPE